MRTLDELEFHQNVPVARYVENAGFWSFIVAAMVLEQCIRFNAIKLETKEQKFLFIKRLVLYLPYDWRSQEILLDNLTTALENYWRCFRELNNIIVEDDKVSPKITAPDVISHPALTCATIIDLSIEDVRCDASKLETRVNYYLRPENLNKVGKTQMDRIVNKICEIAEGFKRYGIPHPACP